MAKLRAHNITISVDGFMAGPDQSLEQPLGRGGENLHGWMFATRGWHEMTGQEGGSEGLDNSFMVAADENIGAHIMGRNMFGPVRGPWPDESWTGWWGPNPPYHHPVFVLTHHQRPPVPMEGGTTFHFVDDGIEAALERAVDAAAGADVRLGGGASAIRQYLRAGLLDELHLAVVPVLLGSGERIFEDLESLPDGYACIEFTPTPAVTHVRLARK